MAGDEKRRFCTECGHDVHALAAYSEEEWAALLAKGRVCAYSAGETLVPQSRRSVMAGALLTTIAPLLAQSGTARVIVTDVTGAPVGRAEVNLRCADGKLRAMVSDGSGVAAFQGLPLGTCEVNVKSPGFKSWSAKEVVGGTASVISAQLEVAAMGAFVSPGRLVVMVDNAAQAEVTVKCLDGKARMQRTENQGTAEFYELPEGDCSVKVWQRGLEVWQGTHKVVGGEERLRVRLEVGRLVGEYIEVPYDTSVSPRVEVAAPKEPKKAKKRFRFWR